ncbi:hypothetical protein F5Y14DRAFT_113925 [Nemania sp. NC0429]|nr:hypothetical protein F5Y14DRAFT_113925 [Nemania sp. NC0429]
MSTTDRETASPSHPQTAPPASGRRPLFKGTLSPPCTKPTGKSYTLAPVSISEVLIRDPAARRATGTSFLFCCAVSPASSASLTWDLIDRVGHSTPITTVSVQYVLSSYAHLRPPGRRSTAISSTAVPQPFVDPAVLQRRPPST